MTGSFLEEPPVTAQVQALFDDDLKDDGYIWNVSRLWAHQPDTMNDLFDLMSAAFRQSGLSFRQRGILVIAAASALGDSYCSLAWSEKLGKASEPALAAGVLTGSDAGLTDQEKAMAAWARKVARDPNATTPADIQALRDAGLDDGQIFAITTFVALRLAFSTINDALGTAAQRAARRVFARRGTRGRHLRPPGGDLTPRPAGQSGLIAVQGYRGFTTTGRSSSGLHRPSAVVARVIAMSTKPDDEETSAAEAIEDERIENEAIENEAAGDEGIEDEAIEDET